MHRQTPLILILLLVPILGCDEEKLAKMANENSARQAEQNREMAKLNQHVAEGTKRLVEADAAARKDLIQVQQKLDQQRQEIHAEQKQLAEQRHRDPIIANSILGIVVLLVCALPVVLGIYILRATSQQGPEDGLAELLVMELASDQPALGSGPLLPSPTHDARASTMLPPAEAADGRV
jgi:hypothetical protein